MNEMGRPSEYDEELIRSFQEEMAERIKQGGSEDLKYISPEELGGKELQAFGLLERLNDGAITMEMFRDELSRYQSYIEENKNLNHYFAWLRNQAMRSLSEKQ